MEVSAAVATVVPVLLEVVVWLHELLLLLLQPSMPRSRTSFLACQHGGCSVACRHGCRSAACPHGGRSAASNLLVSRQHGSQDCEKDFLEKRHGRQECGDDLLV